ncbi:RIP metalloprotease RseP [Candidatus Uhrbacteria bacterium RIFOXYC2_FULL_47_19]|uniref:Zinc metalloprotease n=1 Tax=Candidatus Uhrbacteria bacterium RIFOXYC2_FULL_47_19 TaxID=1802424 RepID=A0A1F7WD48_9BACT|nr:MAG: RIP metalloprotease RseP [Candidatus Uhrbacteria bacterium RIFOXYC2_FULL_47_19]HCC22254.1 RIP metalloprotease RseP [Candidatus Uhrbacteria bacterium]
MLGAVIIFIVILSLAVFVHECGHFFFARKFGVKVEEFGFGFPPRLYGFKRGGTIYSVNAIPVGGFVRLKGESGNSRDKDSFSSQSVAKRAVIIGAGVVMNAVLAWVLFTIGCLFGLPQVVGEGADLPTGARISDQRVHVVQVLEGSPADEAGVRSGDIIVSVDGRPLVAVAELSALTGQTDDSGLVLALDRDDEVVEVRTTPAVLPSGQTGIGVQLVETGLVSYPFYLAPLQGLFVTASYTYEITSVFLQIIGDLVTAGRPSVDVSGPIGIAVITGEVAKFGFLYLLQFTALLSINLGVLNVLPLPALDGGRLLFLLIEKLRGRSVGVRFEGIVHNIGFLLLMIMVVVITYGDVLRFGDQILQSFSGVFSG